MSCMVDSCRGFIQQTNNPTYEGLANLEEEIFSTYSMEPAKELLRPIATGSVLGVFTDEKWYRCQVVSFNSVDDTCDIKFVDHGGYTTVSVSALRQLKADFLRLPFQAIEVYLAHVNPAEQEIQTDIASEVAPNSANVVVPAPEYYPADYYCQNSGAYYQQGQPTIAYVYQDQNGMNQIYYVAGPYMVPQNLPYTTTEVNSPPSSDSGVSSPCQEVSSQEETSSSDEATEHTTESTDSHNFINKPFEDWTQE